MSFQQTDIPFPIQGSLDANTTRVKVDGMVADLANISGIDVNLAIEGDTLASLYPFLLLPLPASPPDAFDGRLVKSGNRYAIDNLKVKIGSTDVRCSGAYLEKEPRPLLTADLQSKLLNIADLGPVIGLETKATKASSSATRPKASDTSTREQAKAKERATSGKKVLPSGTTAGKGDGILPTGKFEGGRLRAVDAEVTYRAADLKAPTALPVEDMQFKFSLHDAVAKLEPRHLGFDGGAKLAKVTLDARDEKLLRSDVKVDFRGLKVAKIVPDSPRLANGAGTIGAQMHLRGTGDSIADAAAGANGDLAAAVAGGRISNLVDAAAGLNGGKILALLAGGDKEIAVHCGAIAFEVKNGHGNSRVMAVDTEQTVVQGSGAFSLKDERFDVRIEAKPKSPGILSFRTPIHAWGSFREAEFELEKVPLLARGGAALVLGTAVNPFAAVLALIEPGTKEQADCQQSSKAVGNAYSQAIKDKKKMR
ncbi:AsmA family protein [Acidovorax sp.]|uniref:AsmA family protein n=1 Tax=Acidovorax sp. TaxID=1872122 RepID=UPI00391EF981